MGYFQSNVMLTKTNFLDDKYSLLHLSERRFQLITTEREPFLSRSEQWKVATLQAPSLHFTKADLSLIHAYVKTNNGFTVCLLELGRATEFENNILNQRIGNWNNSIKKNSLISVDIKGFFKPQKAFG